LAVVDKLARGPVAGIKQDPTLVTKAPKLKKEMGLIDWSKPADGVCRQIRALQPWPTAYTYLHRTGHTPVRVIVCRAKVIANPCRRSENQERAEFHNLEFVSLSDVSIPPAVLELIPESVARENQVLPLSVHGNTLKLVTSQPDNYDVLQKVQFLVNMDIQPVLASPDELQAAISRSYRDSSTLEVVPGSLHPEPHRILVRTSVPGRGLEMVEIMELQPAGKRRLTAAEFLRGHPIQPGDHFGPETP
jgi:methionyl-tRNA formyltransferase